MDLSTVDYRKEMLDAAERYCREHGITLATLGNKVAQDFRFFTKFKNKGKASCTVDTFQRVMRWFEQNMPSALGDDTAVLPHAVPKGNHKTNEVLG